MNEARTEDLLLARQVIAGDQHALERFYDLYADSLFAFITHHLAGSREEVEDIWQDSLVAALHALPGFQGHSRLFTWLCGIARHKVIDALHRQGKSLVSLESLETEDMGLIDREPLPEEWLQRHSIRIQVVMTLQELPNEYRMALIARYADEKSISDVAHALGKSYKATESLLTRARGAFSAAFKKKNQF